MLLPSGDWYKVPATKEGELLTWDGKSLLYKQDGQRFILSGFLLKDDKLDQGFLCFDKLLYAKDSRIREW